MEQKLTLQIDDRIFKLANFITQNDLQYKPFFEEFFEDMPDDICKLTMGKLGYEGMVDEIYWRVKFYQISEDGYESVVITKIKDGKKEMVEIQYGGLSSDCFDAFPLGYGMFLYKQVFKEDANNPEEEFSYFDQVTYVTDKKKDNFIIRREGISMSYDKNETIYIKPKKISYEELLDSLGSQEQYDKIAIKDTYYTYEGDVNLYGDSFLMTEYEPFELNHYEYYKNCYNEARRNGFEDSLEK